MLLIRSATSEGVKLLSPDSILWTLTCRSTSSCMIAFFAALIFSPSLLCLFLLFFFISLSPSSTLPVGVVLSTTQIFLTTSSLRISSMLGIKRIGLSYNFSTDFHSLDNSADTPARFGDWTTSRYRVIFYSNWSRLACIVLISSVSPFSTHGFTPPSICCTFVSILLNLFIISIRNDCNTIT